MESLTTTVPSENGSQAPPQPSRPRRIWLWLLLGALVGGGLLWWVVSQSSSESETAAAQPVAVRIESVQLNAVENSSEFVGELEAQQRVIIRPEAAGYIAQIFVAPGQRIRAGTNLLQLNPDRRQADFRGAIADIEAARASRNTAQAELLAAQSDRDSINAEVALQDKEFERMTLLVEEGALPRQRLDQVTRDRDAALARLRAAARRIQAAQAAVNESVAAVRRSQTDAVAAREDLNDYQVVAPIDGVVGDLPVKVGDYVNTGDLISTLTQNQALELRLSIPIEREADLELGTPVELRLQSGSEPITTGQISFIASRVDNNAQSILAKARFPNPGGRLRDEQFVRTRVIWSRRSGLLVPTKAVSFVGGQPFVFVVNADGEQQTVEQRPIKVGEIQGNSYPVLNGLGQRDRIVTSGILKLSDGTSIVDEAQAATEE